MPTRRSHKSNKSKRSGRIYLPKPQKGSMAPYTTKETPSKRHKQLSRQVRSRGYASVVRGLNLRATLTKNSAPEASEKMRRDMAYIKYHRAEIERHSHKSRNKSSKTHRHKAGGRTRAKK